MRQITRGDIAKFSGDQAWFNHNHANIPRCKFDSQCIADCFNGVFRGTVRAAIRQSKSSAQTADIDDAPVTALAHGGNNALNQGHHAKHIGLELLA